jgi:hypothetical protein
MGTIVQQGLEIGTAGKEKMDCILGEGGHYKHLIPYHVLFLY